MTALMRASRQGHKKVVALLLSKGAEINAVTSLCGPGAPGKVMVNTALTLACFDGHIDVVDFLIKSGADMELGDPTPLRAATMAGQKKIVKKLERLMKEKEELKNVVKAEDIEGYRGNTQDVDSLLQFIEGDDNNKKKSKKLTDKVAEKNTRKLSSKSDKSSRRKKMQSPEKDVEEDIKEKGANSEEVKNPLEASEKVSCVLSKNWSTKFSFLSSGSPESLFIAGGHRD